MVAPILSDAYFIVMTMLYSDFTIVIVAVFMAKGAKDIWRNELAHRKRDIGVRLPEKALSQAHCPKAHSPNQ
jgi:hypothetical protein